MVLGFALFWPLGLALLAFLLWSGRMGCWKHGRLSRRHEGSVDRIHERQAGRPGSSGNHAFDEYREATLRRLEEEQRAFLDFLDRLRPAKDKAEFDQFLAEGRPPEAPQPQG